MRSRLGHLGHSRTSDHPEVDVDTVSRHITITPGVAGGKPRISGRRITVQDIVFWHERLAISADEIATEYGLSLADIYAALAYYYDHREEIGRAIAGDEAFVAALRQGIPSKLRERYVGLADRACGQAPQSAEPDMAVEVFIDDDTGVLSWRDSHLNGFVVNAYRKPTSDSLMLHRTSCPHLHRPVAEGRWTRDFVKACATQTDDLVRWSQQILTDAARLKPCHWCKP